MTTDCLAVQRLQSLSFAQTVLRLAPSPDIFACVCTGGVGVLDQQRVADELTSKCKDISTKKSQTDTLYKY
jgi:hypothetical protein